MMMRVIGFMVGICFGVITITGCVSIEEQIASTDPQVHAQGISRARDAAIADLGTSKEERIARLKQLDSDDALCQVIIGISTQEHKNRFRGVSGRPFRPSRHEDDTSRVDANVAVIKTAAEMLKNPTNEQLYEIFAVANKHWGVQTENRIPTLSELPQILDGLAMRLEDKEGIYEVLTGCSGWSRDRKYSLPGETRFKLFQKYIAKEEDMSVLKEIAQNGTVRGISLRRTYGEEEDWKLLNQKAAIEKITDGKVLVELVKEVDNKVEKIIFSRLVTLKDQKSLAQLFTEHDVYGFFEEKDQKSQDVTNAKAAELIALFSDTTAIASLATGAKSFQIRRLAIDKLEDQAVLKEIAKEIKNGDRSWRGTGEEALQKQAIKKLTDVDILKGLRQSSKSDTIKKCVSARMAELGISNVNDIVAAKKYSKDLFIMLADVSDKKDLQKIVDSATLKGVKILAAAKIGQDNAIAEAKKQMASVKGKPADGQFVIDGFYLGMSLEDAFAILYAKYPEVKPSMYVDGDKENFLNIALGAKYPCDFAWSEVGNMLVYRITFTPDLVGKMVGFKGGSFADLEFAAENYLGITFGADAIESRLEWGWNEINCRIALQKVGSITSVGNETLRFFREDPVEDKNLRRNIMRSDTYKSAMQSAFFGTKVENTSLGTLAKRCDESLQDVNYRFAHKGSLRLCKSKSAPKGLLGARGSFGKPSGTRKRRETSNRLDDERENASDDLERALDDAKDHVEDALKRLDNMNIPDLQQSMEALRGLGL